MSFVVVPFLLLGVGLSPADVALALGGRGVGYAAIVLLGGVAADRFDTRRVMVVSDLVRAVTQAATLAVVVTGGHALAVFIALQVVFGVAEGVFRPSARRVLPTVVAEPHLERANGLFATAATTGLLVGPSIAAVFAALALSPLALALDALSFAASALLLARLPTPELGTGLARVPPARARPSAARQSLVRECRAGWSVVARTPWLRLAILVSTVFHATALAGVYALGPSYAEQRWNGAVTWALLVTVFGVGGLCGGLAATRIRTQRPVLVLIGGLLVLSAQPLFVTAPLPMAAIAALQFAAGAALSIFGVMHETAEQRSLDRSVLGRASSIDLFATTLAMPLGYVVCARLAESNGLEAALQTVGVVAVATCALAFTVPACRTRIPRADPPLTHARPR